MRCKIATMVGSCLSSLFICSTANAIVITENVDAQALVDALIIPGSGITVTSSYLDTGIIGGAPSYNEVEVPNDEEVASYYEVEVPNEEVPPSMYDGNDGSGFQSGTFTNTSGTYGLPQQGGIVLSSGNVLDYADGSNTNDSFTTSYGTVTSEAQNSQLQAITGMTNHYDPVELGFTFDVGDDVTTLSFIATFGSEEFPEFVGSSYIDGFGMYVNGSNVAGAQESGASDNDPLHPININHTDFAAVEGTELDGVLAPNGIPMVRFDVAVEPGSTGNTFELLLADASDHILDTTIYLSSFGNFDAENGASEFTPLMPDTSNPTNADGEYVFVLPEVIEEGEVIWFDPDVATGYYYSTDGLFASVTAPSLASVADQDGYQIAYNDGVNDIVATLLASQTLVFSTPVSEFTLTGIDSLLMLDPDDSTSFVTGVTFDTSVAATYITQDAITTYVNDATDVPEPPFLYAFIVFALAGILKRRKH